MRAFRAASAAAGLLLVALVARAQWVPTGPLATVLVVDDCNETAGDVMASRLDPPTIYVCPAVVKLVRKEQPFADGFFLVHEYGHIALQTSDEALADCWASRTLASAPNGRRTLNAAIALFGRRPDDPSPHYGSPHARAERIRRCADEARPGLLGP